MRDGELASILLALTCLVGPLLFVVEGGYELWMWLQTAEWPSLTLRHFIDMPTTQAAGAQQIVEFIWNSWIGWVIVAVSFIYFCVICWVVSVS